MHININRFMESALDEERRLKREVLKSLGLDGFVDEGFSLLDMFGAPGNSSIGTSPGRDIEQIRGWNFSAILAKSLQFGIGTVGVFCPLSTAKAIAKYNGEEYNASGRFTGTEQYGVPENWVQSPLQHRIARLMRRPNPWSDISQFLFELSAQIEAHGVGTILVRPNSHHLPAELWVIPRAQIQPIAPSIKFPEGSYRTGNLSRLSLGFNNEREPQSKIEALAQISNKEFSAKWIITTGLPSLVYCDDFLNPSSALADALDTDTEIHKSRRTTLSKQMTNGPRLEMLPGNDITGPERDKILEEFEVENMGVSNAGRAYMPPKGVKVVNDAHSAREMEFSQSAEQSRDAILGQRLWPSAMLGLGAGGSYAQIVGLIKGTARLILQPMMRIISGQLTIGLQQYFEPQQNQFMVLIQAASIDDPETKQREIGTLIQGTSITVGDLRKAFNLEPFGDERDDAIAGTLGQTDPAAGQPGAAQGGKPGPADELQSLMDGKTPPKTGANGGDVGPDKPGIGAPVEGDSTEKSTTNVFGGLTRQQFVRNRKAVMETLQLFEDKKLREKTAIATLKTLGLSPEQAQEFIDSVKTDEAPAPQVKVEPTMLKDSKPDSANRFFERISAKRLFQEEKIHRWEKGDPRGGQFAPKDGGEPVSQDQPAPEAFGWKNNVTPSEFVSAKNKSPRTAYLSAIEPSDLKNHKLFLSNDGKVGAAVSPDGDIQNVFNNGGPRGAAQDVLLKAIKAGGKTLDCYDGFLPGYYSSFGMKETGRIEFNRDYAPDGWDYDKLGEPDVVFMSLAENVADNDAKQRASQWKSTGLPKPEAGRYYEGDQWDTAKSDSLRAAVGERSGEEPKPNADGPANQSGSRANASAGRIENFKRWFGNSKAVNADGSPQVLYHGTSADFTEFDNPYAKGEGQSQLNMFTTNPDYAAAHIEGFRPREQKILPVYIRAENPLDLTHIPAERSDATKKIIAAMEDAGVKMTPEIKSLVPIERDAYQVVNRGFRITKLQNALKEAGIDSVVMNDTRAVIRDNKQVYVPGVTWTIFDANQVKSATGNVGAYSRKDNDITKSAKSAMFGKSADFDAFLQTLAENDQVPNVDEELAQADIAERSKLIADILVSVYGDDVLQQLSDSEDFYTLRESYKAFDETKYTRHPKGSRHGGQFAPKNSAEAVAAAHDTIDFQLSGIKTEHSAANLASLLSMLTVKELREIKQKYQMQASGRTKADLVAKIAKRLDSGRRYEPAVQPERQEKQPYVQARPDGKRNRDLITNAQSRALSNISDLRDAFVVRNGVARNMVLAQGENGWTYVTRTGSTAPVWHDEQRFVDRLISSGDAVRLEPDESQPPQPQMPPQAKPEPQVVEQTIEKPIPAPEPVQKPEPLPEPKDAPVLEQRSEPVPSTEAEDNEQKLGERFATIAQNLPDGYSIGTGVITGDDSGPRDYIQLPDGMRYAIPIDIQGRLRTVEGILESNGHTAADVLRTAENRSLQSLTIEESQRLDNLSRTLPDGMSIVGPNSLGMFGLRRSGTEVEVMPEAPRQQLQFMEAVHAQAAVQAGTPVPEQPAAEQQPATEPTPAPEAPASPQSLDKIGCDFLDSIKPDKNGNLIKPVKSKATLDISDTGARVPNSWSEVDSQTQRDTEAAWMRSQRNMLRENGELHAAWRQEAEQQSTEEFAQLSESEIATNVQELVRTTPGLESATQSDIATMIATGEEITTAARDKFREEFIQNRVKSRLDGRSQWLRSRVSAKLNEWKAAVTHEQWHEYAKKKGFLTTTGNFDIDRTMRNLGVTKDDLASIIGATDDMTVRVTNASWRNGLQIEVSNGYDNKDPGYVSMSRTLYKDTDGKLVLSNNSFRLGTGAPKGKGLEIFSRSVAWANKIGVDKIETCPCRSPNQYNPDGTLSYEGMVGYAVWPQFGYDADFSQISESVRNKVRDKFPEARTIRDIYDTPGGPEWWWEHGNSISNATFVPKKGSRNMRALQQYMSKKKKARERAKESATA